MSDTEVFLGQSPDKPEILLYDRANRHGVVAGATGTGKTVTLQIMAQGFSDAGVPVFCADVKGDLSGICVPGSPNEKLLARAAGMGLTNIRDQLMTRYGANGSLSLQDRTAGGVIATIRVPYEAAA